MSIGLSYVEAVATFIVRETRLDGMEMKTNKALITQEYKASKKCPNKNMMGHLAKNYRLKKHSSQKEKDNRKEEQICYKCDRGGDIAMFCYKTCNRKEDNKATAMVAVPTALPMTESPLEDGKWILYYGSTCHIFTKEMTLRYFKLRTVC